MKPGAYSLTAVAFAATFAAACGERARDPESNCEVESDPVWRSLNYSASHRLPRQCSVPVDAGGNYVEYQVIVEGPNGQASELRSLFYNRDRTLTQVRTEPFRSISAYRDRADLRGYYPAGTAGVDYNPNYPIEDYV